MKVSDVMTKAPAYCSSDTNLGAAAEIMWSRNCGFLPIVGSQEELAGVVTDRDLCIAMATRNRLPGEIAVKEVASGVTYSCKPSDDIRTALETMAEKKVRRLPVVNAVGKLEGILSVDDVVLRTDAQARGNAGLSSDEVVQSLRKVYGSQFRQPLQQKTATA
jgi:CBS domain-containing protein